MSEKRMLRRSFEKIEKDLGSGSERFRSIAQFGDLTQDEFSSVKSGCFRTRAEAH